MPRQEKSQDVNLKVVYSGKDKSHLKQAFHILTKKMLEVKGETCKRPSTSG